MLVQFLEDPLEEGMATHSSILAGESHGQRSLVDYSSWGYKELDMTKWLTDTDHDLYVFSKLIKFYYILHLQSPLHLLFPFYLSVQFSSVAQLCPTLCDPMDCSLPGSSVHGILQQEYWSGVPFPSPGDLPDRGFRPALQVNSLPLCHLGKPLDFLHLGKIQNGRLKNFARIVTN